MTSYLNKLRDLRKELGISQKAMGIWLGMSRENYNSSENGRDGKTITLERLKKFAEHPKILESGITLATLMAWYRLDGASPDEKAKIYEELVTDQEIKNELKKRGLIK